MPSYREIASLKPAVLRSRQVVFCAVMAGFALPGPAATQSLTDLFPQRYVHRTWAIEDGLPANAVSQPVEGPDGYIWVVTIGGLVRFDGESFKVFSSENTPEMLHDRLNLLIKAPDGALFFRSMNNHAAGRSAEGEFFTLPGHGYSPQFLDRLSDGTIRTGYRTGADSDTDVFQIYRGAQFEPSTRDAAALSPIDQHVGFGPDGVAYRVEGPRGFQRLEEGRWVRVPGGSVDATRMALDGAGDIWVLYRDFSIWRLEDGRLRPHPSNLRAEMERIGFGSRGPVCFAVEGSGEFALAAHHPTERASAPLFRYSTQGLEQISEGRALDCQSLVDSRGTRWLASTVGLFRDGERITSSQADKPIEASDGTIWVGAEDGLHMFAPAEMGVLSVEHGTSTSAIYSVFEDRSRRIWTEGLLIDRNTAPPTLMALPKLNTGIETSDGQIWLSNGWHIRAVPPGAPPLPAGWFVDDGIKASEDLGAVKAQFEDRIGRHWIIQARAIGILDGDSLEVQSLRGAQTVAETGTCLWFGTFDGSGLLRKCEGSDWSDVSMEDGLPSNRYRGLHVDRDDPFRIWASSEDRGLVRLDVDADGAVLEIQSIQEAHGLYQNTIHMALEDHAGRLWMNSNQGVFWVWKEDLNDLAEGHLAHVVSTVYTEEHGMANREGNGGYEHSGLVAADGTIWFATMGGLAVFDPDAVRERRVWRPTIESIVAGDSVVSAAGGSWTLSARQRDFAVTFATPRFQNREQLEFEHRLVGYDDAWRSSGDTRVAFTNLDPGSYRFEVRVKARRDRGPVTAAPLELQPFWYETRLFYSLLFLGFLGAPFGVVVYRARLARRREAELNELVNQRTAELRDRTLELELEQSLTERQAAELRALSEAKSRMLANVSHEFRTPLTLIMGPLKQFLARRSEPSDETFELMLRNADRLLGMVNRILDLARLESKSLPFDPVPGDVVASVARIARDLQAHAESRGVEIVIERRDPIYALCDPRHLEKVWSNLLSNAIKFTSAGGKIVVRAREEGDDVVVEVQDTGVGIARDKLPFVFERFYQAESDSRRRYEGTGIGLSLVRELVSLHGGRVSAKSLEGVGSTFSVFLPLVPADVTAGTPSLVIEPHAVRRAVKVGDDLTRPFEEDHATVLVVDDNTDVRGFLASVLEGTFNVRTAVDGVEGLRLVQADPPDLVITDVMMPKMDGFEFNRALKAQAATEGIPVVMLTALAETDSRLEGLAGDADRYITKPVDPELLLAELSSMLRIRSRLRGQAPIPADEPTPKSALERRMREFVLERLDDPELNAQTMAEQEGLSYSAFSRRLKREVGVSPTQFIRDLRVEVAVEMMRRREGNLSEIAYAVGFNSLSYFNRCFKAKHGMSPSAFELS